MTSMFVNKKHRYTIVYFFVLVTGNPNTFISVIKINVLCSAVHVCFESFRRELNEAKVVYISVTKINVLLFTFVCVSLSTVI